MLTMKTDPLFLKSFSQSNQKSGQALSEITSTLSSEGKYIHPMRLCVCVCVCVHAHMCMCVCVCVLTLKAVSDTIAVSLMYPRMCLEHRVQLKSYIPWAWTTSIPDARKSTVLVWLPLTGVSSRALLIYTSFCQNHPWFFWFAQEPWTTQQTPACVCLW